MRCYAVSYVDLMCNVRRTAQKQAACFGVRSDALEKCESVADTVRSRSRQLRRVEQRVNRYDLLEKGSHDT